MIVRHVEVQGTVLLVEILNNYAQSKVKRKRSGSGNSKPRYSNCGRLESVCEFTSQGDLIEYRRGVGARIV